MRFSRFSPLIARALLAAAAVLPAWAAAQAPSDFPSRQITILSPFAAGGGTDALARAIAEKLAEAWKQPVVVDNRTGAGGKVALQALLRARPDGYTLMVSNTGVLHTLHLDPNPGYKLPDVLPLVRLADVPVVLSVHKSFKGSNLKEYLEEVRKGGKGFAWGSSGAGSTAHIVGAALGTTAGLPLVHVPYKGEVPMMTDLVAGHQPAAISSSGAAKPFVERGDIRTIAVMGNRRLGLFPDVPTFPEQGFPELNVVGFNGLFAAAGTPPEVAARIAQEVDRIMKLPEIREKLAPMGFEPVNNGLQFPQQAVAESETWGRLIRKYGITIN